MKKIIIWFLIFILLFLLITLMSGTIQFNKVSSDSSSEEFYSYMDDRILALMKKYQIPGCSIAIVKDREITWLKAYGFADTENNIALTPDTPMRVQSISKSVTAWGIMKLVEQGKLKLDSPVSQYIKSWSFPESDFDSETITIRQLLSHTAGLPLGDVFTIYSPEEAMPTLLDKLSMEAIPFQKPGTSFYYSNTGYNLLELLIEEVTGLGFSEFMRTEIMLPLGMDNATFEWSEKMSPAPPIGYDLRGELVPVYVYPEKASGGLFATAEDIAKFMIAGMGSNDLLDKESVDLIYTSECEKIGIYDLVFDSYGFGHYLETLSNGELSVSHGGQGSGIMTHMQFVPQSGDGIVILTNSQRSWPFISYILGDWADWRGFSPVGMEMIGLGRYVICAFIAILITIAFVLVRYAIVPLTKRKCVVFNLRKVRWFGTLASILIMSALIWCSLQEYLFIIAIFPILTLWLGVAMLLFAFSMLFYSLAPGMIDNRI